jgi:hypothetical protein
MAKRTERAQSHADQARQRSYEAVVRCDDARSEARRSRERVATTVAGWYMNDRSAYERLLDYADMWRRNAHRWTAQAEDCGVPAMSEALRARASAALSAAHEADDLFRRRQAAADRVSGGPG